jgi:hypothetical protein
MKSSNDLFQLISSMSQTEKRYFKVYASKHVLGEKNKYVKLFEAIEIQSEYDEDTIRREFKAEKFLKQLPVAKNYLYSLILKSLNLYYTENSPVSKINELISGAKILFGKELFKPALNILARARELCIRHDNSLKLLETMSLEKKIIAGSLTLKDIEKRTEQIVEQEKKSAEKLKNYNDYYYLLLKSYLLLTREGAVTKFRTSAELGEFDKIMNNPLMKKENMALSYEAKICFYKIHTIYHGKKGDFKKSSAYSNKLIEFIESNPDNLREDITDYIIALNNQLVNIRNMKDYKGFMDTMAKLKSISVQYKGSLPLKIRVTIFISTYLTELLMHLELGQFDTGLLLIPEIEKGLEKYKGKINIRFELTFYYGIASTYFGLSRYNEALLWTNKIINQPLDSGLDLVCFAKIMNLILHYELENYDLLEYILKSTYRFLSQRKRVYEFEFSVLNFVRKSFRVKTDKELRKLFTELRDELIKISAKPFEKNALDELDLVSWLSSKIENHPLSEILKRKNSVQLQ